MNESKWTVGKVITRNKILPRIVVDFSDAADMSVGEWTVGKVITRNKILPPISVEMYEVDELVNDPDAPSPAPDEPGPQR